MKLLKNINDVNSFMRAVDNCKRYVILRSCDGSEEFNLKSKLSTYIAIGRLAEEHGDEWEIFCQSSEDEYYMMKFFDEIRNS